MKSGRRPSYDVCRRLFRSCNKRHFEWMWRENLAFRLNNGFRGWGGGGELEHFFVENERWAGRVGCNFRTASRAGWRWFVAVFPNFNPLNHPPTPPFPTSYKLYNSSLLNLTAKFLRRDLRPQAQGAVRRLPFE